MALGDGTEWDEGAPITTEPRADGADEIRDLRKGVKIRINKEHVTLATSSAGGEHKEGSAKAYYESSAPTNRPDGSTALVSEADDGRLWIDSDNDVLSHWAGGAWVEQGLTAKEGTFSGSEITDYNNIVTVTIDPGFLTKLFHFIVEGAGSVMLPTMALLNLEATAKTYRQPRSLVVGEGVTISRAANIISVTKIAGTTAMVKGHWVAMRF